MVFKVCEYMKKAIPKALSLTAQTIFDKKGFNILGLDIHELSNMTDYVIIAEGNIDRHVRALGLEIQIQLKQIGEMPLFAEGLQTGDWVVLDYGNFVVHLLTSDMREKYELEELWQEARIVDLGIVVPKENAGTQA
jgi:ribosome-associated protein